jgi:cysteine synthase A
MHELVGHTPMVRLSHVGAPEGVGLFAKLELWNPSGSVKDRTGMYMVQDAERRGLLHPGSTIVEGTAGNMGLGIAFAALGKGYRVIFVVPEKFSEEKQTLMRALGAEIVSTSQEGGMSEAASKADELASSIPGAVALGQFHNQANPQAHYETTGPEIWDDLDGDIDCFVAGAGSGGTFTGIMRLLKERDPSIRGILADPVGSTMGGGTHADYATEGIGNDFVAETMDMSLVDKVVKVDDEKAYEGSRLLAREEGIIAGSSSGAALAAALEVARGMHAGTVVTLFPDRGDRYFSKHLFA